MPIINEHSKTVFEMRKQQHRFLARIVNWLLRYGIPYCYKITNEYTKPLYTIDCVFPGIRYKLTEHSSSQIVQIIPQRVQLIERRTRLDLIATNIILKKTIQVPVS